jgi:NAD(P)H-flavin reductase/hemoglobin-like flavoprotein
VSSGSGSGSGADQHLLALLRAIRLRQAAPDAVASGIADTAAALTGQDTLAQQDALAQQGDEDEHRALPPSGTHEALPPAVGRLGLPPAPPHTGGRKGPVGRPAWASGDPAGPADPDAEAPTGDLGRAATLDFFGRPPRADGGPPARDTAPGAGPSEPGGAAAGRFEPGVAASGHSEPGVAASGRSEPGVAAGGHSEPGVAASGRFEPGAAAPGRSEPGATAPRHFGPRPPAAGRRDAGGSADTGDSADAGRGATPADRPATGPGTNVASNRRGPRPGPAAGQSDPVPRVDHGPLLRPAGLPPIEPTRPAPPGSGAAGVAPAAPGAGPPHASGHPGAGPAGDRARTHRNPARTDRARTDPAATRPSWADRDHSAGTSPIGAIHPLGGPLSGVPAVPPVPGAHPPRLPGIETPLVARPAPSSPVAPPKAATPADGMDPADDALLRETQRLLSTSLTFAGGPFEVAERFRAALLQAHPTLIAALPGGPRIQTEQLAQALTWLVHHLDHPPVLVDGCGRLGAALAECGVRPEQLQLVGAALAEAMRAGMPGGAWRQDFDLAWRSTWQHAYEWILHGATLAAEQPTVWTAVVVGHDLRRHDLAVVRLRPYLPMPFRPGQYARIEVPELPGTWRPYSLSGAPRRDNVIELHVRAKTHSGVSGTLVYRTEVGDEVRLRRAEGAMGLPGTPDRDLLMIAGDTGVAPLKALLTELADTGDPRSAVLFWGVRNLDELYDIEEITEIARAAKRVTVVPVISEGDPGPYASGLVTDAVAAYGEWSRHEVYLAGPPLMLAATSAALRQLGVAPERIHHDLPE